jgi:hypothetical protein
VPLCQLSPLVETVNLCSNAPADLLLRLSYQEAILVTTQVDQEIGLARPLCLTAYPEGHQVVIDQGLKATLKLTLLHHRAKCLTELRLNGVYVPKCAR